MEPTLTHIFSAFFWALLLGILAWKSTVFGPNKKESHWFTGLFFLKIATGITVWLIYTHYYTDKSTSDIYRFFSDSEIVYNLLFEKPVVYLKIITGIGGQGPEILPYYDLMNNWYKSFDDGFINENRTLIRLNAFLMIFTGASYFGNLVIVCFFSVWAQSYLFHTFFKTYTLHVFFVYVLLNLWPSQLFWTSALMKEPILMTGMALCVGGVVRLKNRISFRSILIPLLGIFLALFSKFYVGIALAFPLTVYLLLPQKSSVFKSLLSYGGMVLVFLLLVFISGYINPAYDIPSVIAAKKQAFANVAVTTDAGSAFYIPPMEPTLWGMMKLAPQGLFNALLRPFPQDAGNLMEWASVVENFLFIGLLLVLAFRIRFNSEGKNLAIALFIFSLIVLILGGITVNISGALMRYKMPVMPYLSLALFLASKYAQEIPKPNFSDTE